MHFGGQALISGGLAKALNGIALFDPQNAVEFDIVRQFITGFSFEDLQKHPELAHLRKIIESGAKYPIVKLKEYLVRNTDKISPSDFPDTRFRVLGVSNTKGIFLNETLEGSEIKQSYFRVQPMQLCYNPYRVNVGSIGLCEFDYDNQIISGAYEIFGTVESDLHPKYFMALLKAPQFLAYVDEKAHGGVRMNFKYEYLEEWEIPLPPMETQELIVAENDRQGKIISGAELVLKNWQIEKGMFSGNEIALSEIADIGTGSTPSRSNGDYFGGSINWVLTTEVDECEIHTTAETLTDKAIKDYGLKIYPSGTILVAMYGQGKTRGKAALLKCNAAITQNCAAIMIHRDDVIPKYIYYYLRSMYEVIRGQEYSGAGVPHLNLKIIGNIRVPIPDKEIQLAVVAEVDRMLFVADNLRTVIAETEKNIRQIMSQTWKN
jgi:restriction endonuclease S subunit